MTPTSPNRPIRPNSELGNLVNFGSLQMTDPIVNKDGTVQETVEMMKKIVRDHHTDVSKIAEKLYDPKLSRFLKNIFNFVMAYVKYETDSAFTEQLRTPLRTLKDQRGDCDCTSILIGSILYNKNIPFNFRVSKYDANRDFSHVYVIVHRNGDSGYYVMDTVIKSFDKEKPFVGIEDYLMDSRLSGFSGLNGIPIQLLNGVTPSPFGGGSGWGFYGLYGNIMGITLGADLTGFGLGSAEDDETAMYNHLVRTRNVILAAPHMFKVMKNPLEVARMLDYAIRYWDTPQIDHVLGILEKEEQRLLRDGVIVYPHADLSGAELGELLEGVFKKVGQSLKKTAQKVGKGVATAAKATGKAVSTAAKATGKAVAKAGKAVGKGVATAAKATGKAIATAAKKTGEVVAKFNPVSLAARGGILMAIRLNMFKLADKLQYGLYTEEQAQAAGLKMDNFRSMQDGYHKTRKLFVNTLKGKESALKQAISKGVKHKAINGLGDLNALGIEPATASIITAAMGFITNILNFFKGKRDPVTDEEYPDETVTENEVLDVLKEAEKYGDEDSIVNTTTQPNAEDFWQRATGLLKTAVNTANKYLPSGGGGDSSSANYYPDDEYEYDYQNQNQNQQKMIISPSTDTSSAVTAKVMTGGMMSNIGEFFKKNAIWLGVGAIGIAGGIYLLTRNKKSGTGKSKGLSGVSRSRTQKRKPKTRMKSMKLK